MFSLLFLYEWNLCMFTLSFVYINGIFGCFPRLIPIEYVNDFYLKGSSRNPLSQLSDPSLIPIECFDIIVEHVVFP
jgi:hypothetical protein